MSNVGKAKKKPVIVDFVLWAGSNGNEVFNFMDWKNASHDKFSGLVIHTLEGDMYADEGDYILKGVQGEFYPCKPDIFLATYDVLREN